MCGNVFVRFWSVCSREVLRLPLPVEAVWTQPSSASTYWGERSNEVTVGSQPPSFESNRNHWISCPILQQKINWVFLTEYEGCFDFLFCLSYGPKGLFHGYCSNKQISEGNVCLNSNEIFPKLSGDVDLWTVSFVMVCFKTSRLHLCQICLQDGSLEGKKLMLESILYDIL